MLDIRAIRDNPSAFIAALVRRGWQTDAAEKAIGDLALRDEARKAHVTRLQDLQSRQNAASRQIGIAKGRKDEELAARLLAEVADLKAAIQAGEAEERILDHALDEALALLPNCPHADVPDGLDETANVVRHVRGEKPRFDFTPREHFEIPGVAALFDFERAGRIAGARFAVLRGELARLERALGQYFLDTHTMLNGFAETSVPLLVNDRTMYGTGQLPKFSEDLFRTTDGRWLIPTAEVPLTNLVAGEILDEAALPLRLVALTPCFRSEAGSAGRDVRGVLRQHQFWKVELVTVCAGESSDAEQLHMLASAESVLDGLGLHYRVVTLCAGDMGFGAARTFDIEVWLPGQNAYREISSVSTCADFQGRRMNARYRPAGAKGTRFVHTLNGSGVAVGRALIAVLENGQNADGTVTVPPVLRRYMAGAERIGVAAA